MISDLFQCRSTRPVIWRRVQRWRETPLGLHGCQSMWLRAAPAKSNGCATCAEHICPTRTSCRLAAGRWRRATALMMEQRPARRTVSSRKLRVLEKLKERDVVAWRLKRYLSLGEYDRLLLRESAWFFFLFFKNCVDACLLNLVLMHLHILQS